MSRRRTFLAGLGLMAVGFGTCLVAIWTVNPDSQGRLFATALLFGVVGGFTSLIAATG